MSTFTTTTRYSEQRPAYTGEASYLVTATLEGSGSIVGQTFTGKLYNPTGAEVASAVSVAISVAASRVVAVTIVGQLTAGDYRWVVRRTDDSSAEVVAEGVIEVVNPAVI